MKKARLIAFLAAAALAATATGGTLSMSTFAAEGDPVVSLASETHSITIQQKANSNDTATHKYEAYQLFTGDLTGETANDPEAAMTKIQWGSNVDTAALESLLLGDTVNDYTAPASITALFSPLENFKTDSAPGALDATKIAEVIAENAESDSDLAKTFADVFNAALTGTPATDTAGTISGLNTGYYLIKDEDGSQDGNKHAAYTDFILRLVNDTTITAKEDVPTLSKKIVDSNGTDKANTAAIGDVINYQLDSVVPSMEGYETYFFIVNDTMDPGLTFDETSVDITVGGNPLTVDDDYYVNTPGADGETFEIVFKNFIQYRDSLTDNKNIVIKYSATLNEKADRTNNGNENTVDLTFSNNPNKTNSGKPGKPNEPGDKDPVGKTPEDKVKTFTTGIRVIKVDQDGNRLSGVKFELSATSGAMNKVLVLKDTFEPAEDGTYYLLKNGTYTDKLVAGKEELYDSTTTKYKKATRAEVTAGNLEDASSGKIEATVDEAGYLVFAGLNAGSYVLTEKEAPAGYNMAGPVYIEIEQHIPTEAGTAFENLKPNWKIGKSNVDADDAKANLSSKDPDADNDDTIDFVEVENRKGIILPATGGIGTVIFYVVGSLLIAAAAVLFVTRRKNSAQEK